MAIQETTFGSKRYLTLKKSLAISQLADKQIYDEAGQKLGEYIQKHNLHREGGWSVLYFTWDEVNQKTNIGIAFPMADLETVDDPELSIVDIPESQAALDVLNGPYEGLGQVHAGLMKYVNEKQYDKTGVNVMAVEEYIVDPMSDSNPEKWVTNVYYLHK